MAASNPKSTNGQKPATQNKGAADSRENLRNLALIVGITLLLILAVILAAFFIAEVVNNGQNPQPTSQTPTPTNAPAPTGDNGNNNKDEANGSTNNGSVSSTATENPSTTTPTTGNSNNTPSSTNSNTGTDSTSSSSSAGATTPSTATATSYTFTAGSGDSVSWLARRAMYAYMGDRGVGLDVGQRLYFEITLTNISNPTALSIGESRTFSASLMDQIFQNAANLPAAEHAAWNTTAVSAGYI